MTSARQVSSASPLTISVLRALADGATDREVARDLHVSTRTVQRVVDDFKSETGTRTRLAAGVAACRLGLLDTGTERHDRGRRPGSGPSRDGG